MNALRFWFPRAFGVLLLLAFGGPPGVVAQPAPTASSRALIVALPATPSGKAATLQARLATHRTVRRARAVAMDRVAFDANRITLPMFPDAELTADRVDIGYTGVRSRTWTGRLSGGGSAAFVINGDRISGTVSSTNGNFEFFPAGSNECVVVQHLPNGYADCAVGHVTPPPQTGPTLNATNLPPNGDTPPAAADPSAGDASQGDTPTGNRIRVIVAYTSSAKALTSSTYGRTMQEHIDLAVLESNQGYANSGVTLRMELCCLYQTGFTETTAIENDVDALRAPADGKADEIHGYRADYDADMCCLIVDGRDTDWCGWAYGFDYTAYDNMFQCTSYSCATGNYSFAHEFGHTQGCRHDNDGTLTPFPYAHGFRNGNNWRTIMAVSGGNTAPRLNYWSNPNINSPVSPFTAMGTPINGGNFANDCRSGLNASDNTVVNHELTPASTTLPSGYTFDSDEGADKVVTGTLTAGSFTANSGSRVTFRAGSSVVLTPGFRARSGSEFRARITSPLGDPAPGGDTQPANPAP